MNKIVCYEGSSHAREFFEKHYESFKPVTKLVSFFHCENFVFTPYNIDNPSIHTIIINDKGDQMLFSGLICGYGGDGPNRLAEVLNFLGIDIERARRWMRLPGIQIEFPEDITYLGDREISISEFFVTNSPVHNVGKFNLNEYTLFSISRKQIIMLNPQRNNFQGLLNVLCVMNPNSIEYFIGNNSPLYNSVKISDIEQHGTKTFNRADLDEQEANLIIYGEKFDLICYVNKNELIGTINAIHLFLKHEPLFKSKFLGDYVISSPYGKKLGKIDFFLQWLLNRKKSPPIQETIWIDKKVE